MRILCAIFIAANVVSVWTFSNRTTECPPGRDITCPFLKLIQPDTASFSSFVGDLRTNGNVGKLLASAITFETTRMQKGAWAAMTGAVPDLCALDQVPGISHKDKYNAQLDGVTSRLEAASIDGFVTLQDLVEIKKWVADVEGIADISLGSRGETINLFLCAGGDLATDKVKAANVLSILQSEQIEELGETGLFSLLKGFKLGEW